MAEILQTNVCCVDLRKDCIDYLKGLGLALFKGSLGSVFTFKWDKLGSHSEYVLSDVNLPENLHEYHVFIGDTDNPNRRDYVSNEHQVSNIKAPEEKCLTCDRPINILDLRPYGSSELSKFFEHNSKQKRIKIVFLGAYNSVKYTSSVVSYKNSNPFGSFSNYEAWNVLYGEGKVGNRAVLEDNLWSRALFEGRLTGVKYYHTFNTPFIGDGRNKKEDPHFMSLLKNEDGECISYLYCTDNDCLFVILPQLEDKAAVLKSLFENILFTHFSKFFPDIEAKRWIRKPEYKLPAELAIMEKIALRQEEYEKEIAALRNEAEEVSNKYAFLKKLLTGTGSELVSAVKEFLEWLGFEKVIDQDSILEDNEKREEDLNFEYNGHRVLLEVKGINHTSKDSECSQVDKIVLRRTKQLKTSDVHGVYVVNNQKNVEPISRQMPPFNKDQISDAVNQDRTMIYTVQLFALFSDIEKGFVSKEDARDCFLKPGLADFHVKYKSLGTPYNYHHGNTVICLDLLGIRVTTQDTLYYRDDLQRLVSIKVESIEQNNTAVDYAETGKTAIKVDKKVPKGTTILIN